MTTNQPDLDNDPDNLTEGAGGDDPAETPPDTSEGNPLAPMGYMGVPMRTWVLSVGAVVGGILALVALCGIPDAVKEFQPEPTPSPAPTNTPEPTWTPVPQPTVTPRPITNLPIQQLHYDKYRIFHLLYEYTLCYHEYVVKKIPPTPTPVPAEGEPAPGRTKKPANERQQQQEGFQAPTHLHPHTPPIYGLPDENVEDHVLRDVNSATRWLIARYQAKDCTELPQFTLIPERLSWLHRYSTGS